MRGGDVAFDRFEIESEAGAGGMGVVYRARDRKTREQVALKVMHGLGHEAARRFEREAAALSEIAHPGIVRYVAHGPAWIAMEWLEGEDLEHRLGRKGLTLHESIVLARCVAQALGAAHARGIVHRDVKPANLWLVDGEPAEVKLLDFGIARTAISTSLTAVGAVVGTPAYMAPEQARGSKQVDARADVFSLGCVIFECISGRPAFVGESIAAVLAKVLLEDVPPLGESASVPAEVEAIVARMLAKERDARPPDGAAVAKELFGLELTEIGPRAGPSMRPLALGRGEQRLASVVLIERGGDVAATVAGAVERDGAAVVIEGGVLAAYRRIAKEHGGHAEALADGTTVVALEGQGEPTDQARRAASCALSLMGAASGAKLALATGRTVANGPRPMGEALDRAARLLRAPRPMRGLRADHVTSGLLDSRFEVEGDAAGLALVALRERREDVRTLLGKPTPCVGREADLTLLDGTLARVVGEEAATALIVTAPAGVGKTRLGNEFLQRLRARSTAQVWIGRGDAMTSGTSFALCAQMVRAQAGIQAGEPLESRREKLRARAQRHLEGEVAERVTDFLGEMIGTPFPDNVLLASARRDRITMGDQVRRAWCDFVEAESSAGPLLLMLDDLHWADDGTIEALDIALRVCSDKSLMVLAFARPEADEKFPKLWASRSPTVFALRPLARKQAEKVVRAVLAERADDATVARIVEHADGNAFLLEELVRAVAEGDSNVPETVLGVVEARLAKLDAESRRALRAASVFGQTFWRGAVAALLGGGARTTQTGLFLEGLERGEWIAARVDSSVRGETEYRFRNALVREAAYAMLTEEDRKLGHRLAGEWLAKTGAAHAAALAEHFEKGGDEARAAELWARAAEDALEGNALAAAIKHAERGAANRASGELLGRLRLLEAEARYWRGENQQLRIAAEEAASCLEEASGAWADALAKAGGAALQLGEPERAVAIGERLVAALVRADAGALAAAARLVHAMYQFGQHEHAESLLEHVETHAASSEDSALRAALFKARATRALISGDPASFAEQCEQARSAHERGGRVRAACAERMNTGFALLKLGQFAEAEERLRTALLEADRLGLLGLRAAVLQNLGWTLARNGKLEEGAAVEEEAIRLGEDQSDSRMEGGSRIYRALIALGQGDSWRAESEASRACALLEHVPPMRATALAALGEARMRSGDLRGALSCARDATALLGEHDREDDAYVCLACAEIEHAAGDVAAARERIRDARDRLLESAAKIGSTVAREHYLSHVPEHARTLALAGEWLGV